jgi:hypothetical protein
MTWLIAVALKPLGALLFFGFALFASRLLWPLIPRGSIKTLLYDPSIQKRHPWKFFFLAALLTWGLVAFLGLVVYR